MRLFSLVLGLLLFAGVVHAQPAKPTVIWDPSPNYTAGRGGTTIDAIVIHTTEGTYSGAVSWLKNPSASASAHYVIKEDGSEITQLVDDSDRAWHATYYNSRAIGIECAGFAGQASTWTQGILPKLYDLVAYLCYTYNVQVVHPTNTATVSPQTQDFNGTGLVGHYQVQPWNRTDPGSYFDWNALLTEVNNRLGNTGANDVVIDNTDSGFSTTGGSWSTGSSAAGHYGTDYRFANSVSGTADAGCEWRPNIATAGDYEVMVYYPQGSNRAPDSPFTVNYAGGSATVDVDQTGGGGGWVSLGTYTFNTGTGGYVALANDAGGSVVIADAVKFSFVQASATPPPTGSAGDGGSSGGGCVAGDGSSGVWVLAALVGLLSAAVVVRRRLV